MEYRSSLNADQFSAAQQNSYAPLKPEETSNYEFVIPAGKEQTTQFSLGGAVPIEDAARAEPIGKPLNVGNKTGNRSILFVRGAMRIDGLFLRHAIFRDVEVHYAGAPLRLDDVMFVNCHFVFDNTPKTRFLGEQILMSTKVTANLSAA